MRLSTACDRCKHRKVKCDGEEPCSHCKRRGGETCIYTPTVPTKRPRLHLVEDSSQSLKPKEVASRPPGRKSVVLHGPLQQPTPPDARGDDEETTIVARDSRLQKAHGRLLFIGDCAPLSYLQSVRRFVTTCISPHGFARTGTDVLLEQVEVNYLEPEVGIEEISIADITLYQADTAIADFCDSTSGMVDIGDFHELQQRYQVWAATGPCKGILSAVNYLLLAVGFQGKNPQLASRCFRKGTRISHKHIAFQTNYLTVEALLLFCLYLLRASQPNGSFVHFGLAARASYAIGLHRSEVNARMGPEAKKQRERLWKSLKVVDVCISLVLGRPPALYDLDCTVDYARPTSDLSGNATSIDDFAAILKIIESIVEGVYGSERRLSLQTTRELSRKLKAWADQRMAKLNAFVHDPNCWTRQAVGACNALAIYYYAVMLSSRPFLLFEACRMHATTEKPSYGNRRVFADSCVNAACGLVDTVTSMIQRGLMPHKMPFLVSWLFTASLSLGVALAAGFGHGLEAYLKDAIEVLEFFSLHDAQATQYKIIVKSLLATCKDHIEQQKQKERRARVQAVSDLFGLQASPFRRSDAAGDVLPQVNLQSVPDVALDNNVSGGASISQNGFATPDWEDFDLGGFDDLCNATQCDVFGTLNMFPMFDNA